MHVLWMRFFRVLDQKSQHVPRMRFLSWTQLPPCGCFGIFGNSRPDRCLRRSHTSTRREGRGLGRQLTRLTNVTGKCLATAVSIPSFCYCSLDSKLELKFPQKFRFLNPHRHQQGGNTKNGAKEPTKNRYCADHTSCYDQDYSGDKCLVTCPSAKTNFVGLCGDWRL